MNRIARNWIGGQRPASGPLRPSIDPATYETIGQYHNDGFNAAKQAVTAALVAFRDSDWAHDPSLRHRVMNELAQAFADHRGDLIDILALENGKIKDEAAFEIDMVPSKLRYYAALALTEDGRAVAPTPDHLSVVLRQPMGVAGIIAPWNSPVVLSVRSLAPALAAGCTAVIRLPHQVAQTASLMADIMAQVSDLPNGVVNLVFEGGSSHEGAAWLVESPDVPAISFTGSTATGAKIAANGVRQIKRFGMELGGKTPMIVLDDADIDAAAPVIEKALTVFAGQFCMTGSRLLVHGTIYERVRDRMAARLDAVRVGPASDPNSQMGPMIDRDEVARVDAVIEDALRAGARAVVRGGPVADGPLARGAFFRPALIEVTDNAMPIIQTETFGPVLTIQRVEDDDEAIGLANDCRYGLAAAIWTRDAARGLRLAKRIDAGSVWINDWAMVFDSAEEGGFKASGLGRLNGVAALEDFVEYKHICINTKG